MCHSSVEKWAGHKKERGAIYYIFEYFMQKYIQQPDNLTNKKASSQKFLVYTHTLLFRLNYP